MPEKMENEGHGDLPEDTLTFRSSPKTPANEQSIDHYREHIKKLEAVIEGLADSRLDQKSLLHRGDIIAEALDELPVPKGAEYLKQRAGRLTKRMEDLRTGLVSTRTAAIWISGNRTQGRNIQQKLQVLLEAYGIELKEDGPDKLGSWRQAFKVSRGPNFDAGESLRVSLTLVRDDINKTAGMRELVEADRVRVQLVTELLKAFRDVDEAVVVLEQLVFVKYYQVHIAKIVSPTLSNRIQSSGVLLSDAQAVIKLISEPGLEPATIPAVLYSQDPEPS